MSMILWHLNLSVRGGVVGGMWHKHPPPPPPHPLTFSPKVLCCQNFIWETQFCVRFQNICFFCILMAHCDTIWIFVILHLNTYQFSIMSAKPTSCAQPSVLNLYIFFPISIDPSQHHHPPMTFKLCLWYCDIWFWVSGVVVVGGM